MYKYLINSVVILLFLWIPGQVFGAQLLLPLDVGDGDRFGHSVSVDGSFLAAGAPKHDITDDEGAVYIYQYAGLEWSQFQGALTAPSPTENANFGESLDIQGDVLAVGSPGAEKAYVYAFNGSAWEYRVTISKPGTGAAWDYSEFGYSVAVYGSTIVIGARGYNSDQGCICIYEFDGGTACTPASGNPFTVTGTEDLGYSTAIDENTIVAGAPYTTVDGKSSSGMIAVFDRPSAEGTWSLRQSIDLDSPVQSEYFGSSVAISGPRIVVGAPERSVYPRSGIVYLYDRQMDLSWTAGPVITREPDSSENQDEFGASVAIDGSKIVIGCCRDDIETMTSVGSVWVFEDVTSNIMVAWDATPTFVHNYDESYDRLGSSVAVSGQLIAAGAPYKDRTSSSSNDGAVYAFRYLEGVINEYKNPVLEHNQGDVQCMKYDGWYYLYHPNNQRVYCYRSKDLVNWTYLGEVFNNIGDSYDGGTTKYLFAPEVHLVDGKLYLYYVNVMDNDPPDGLNRDIAVAEGTSPTSFNSSTREVLVNGVYANIDPSMFQDDDGMLYLYHKYRGPIGTGSEVQGRFLSDPMTVGGSGVTLITSQQMSDAGFGGGQIEHPHVVKRFGIYFLFFSYGVGDSVEANAYKICYATSSDPLGPYILGAGNPLVYTGEEPGVRTPGASSVVKDGDGADWMVYRQKLDDLEARILVTCIDRCTFYSNGTVDVNGTRDTWQIGPIPLPLYTADFDNDGYVKLSDLSILSQYWLKMDCYNPDVCKGTNLDMQAAVDIFDLMLFAEQWFF